MSERKRPPCRRPSVTRALVWQTESSKHRFHVTFGLDVNTTHPIEVFYADGQRVGSQLQHTIQDACVVISLALQHGVPPSAVVKSLSTTTILGAIQPATVIGVIAAALTVEVPEI
jgi:hypothetical protein